MLVASFFLAKILLDQIKQLLHARLYKNLRTNEFFEAEALQANTQRQALKAYDKQK